ncbi:fatty acyl-AMP ligase [Actinomadura sp. 1N219]|uniref:fatty acyl-AMP ligase n=1 Tax=Actinomadura sp. 1N219 TaxID=3375152 RepID=UPI003789DC2E
MNENRTFVESMCARAAEHGDRVAVVFSPDPFRAGADLTLTYGELDRDARAIAALLQDRFAPGSRILVLHPTGLDFTRSFIGCLYAGMVPVAAPLPDGYRRQTDRLAAIARDADAAAALADAADEDALAAWADEQDLGAVARIVPAREDLPAPDAWTPPPPDPGALAFLQYTSGSVADPKGVMVDHANVLANTEILAGIAELDAESVLGGWLPMYHDFGLIGQLLTPLGLGGRSVLMAPMAFLRRPVSWLKFVERHGVDFSPAPNFAFDLCVQRVTDEELAGLDLSGWRSAVNGAEPVHAATVEAFTRRFAAAGLRPSAMLPGYGMAETTLVVSGDRPRRFPVLTEVDTAAFERGELRPPEPGAPVRRLVSSGPAEFLDVRIVDPRTCRALPDGRVGEIWVRGANVARGYWRRPEETARVFDAALAGAADGAGGFLRTGDLGVLRAGELYVTGRIKELIIHRGRNLYPQDLEATARTAHPALARGAGAAFAVEVPAEELVVVQECRGRVPQGLAEVAARIRDSLNREHGIVPKGVVLVRPGGVDRTTSGKIQRGVVRGRFLAGDLPVLHAELAPDVVALRAERPGGAAAS